MLRKAIRGLAILSGRAINWITPIFRPGRFAPVARQMVTFDIGSRRLTEAECRA
jgi:hypothetical protein